MNSYNLLSIKTCNFLLLSFKTVVTRKIWEIYQVKDLAFFLGNSRQMGFLNSGFLLLENLFLAWIVSENDCSADHPVFGPSGYLKAQKEQLKKGCSINHPVIGPPGN